MEKRHNVDFEISHLLKISLHCFQHDYPLMLPKQKKAYGTIRNADEFCTQKKVSWILDPGFFSYLHEKFCLFFFKVCHKDYGHVWFLPMYMNNYFPSGKKTTSQKNKTDWSILVISAQSLNWTDISARHNVVSNSPQPAPPVWCNILTPEMLIK